MKKLISILAAVAVSISLAGGAYAGSDLPPESPAEAPSGRKAAPPAPAPSASEEEVPPAPAPMDIIELEYVIDKVQSTYSSLFTVAANFSQEFYAAGFDRPRVSGGRVYFKKPGKMHWRYLTGSRDILVSDGFTMWLYQPDLRQVVKTSAADTSSIATDYLSGLGNLRRDFTVFITGETRDGYVLELTPVAPQPNVRRVLLEVDRLRGVVHKSTVEDFFGNRTVVRFTNIELNTGLDEDLFTFTPPAGVSVVE